MIIGVDAGYYATKTSEGVLFLSRISTKENIISENNVVTLDNKQYTVGEGEMTFELNKINHEITKVCILYALARSSEDTDFDIVTGLPIGLYSKQKEELKMMLSNHRIITLEMNKRRRTIIINNVEIFPQGAGALYSSNIDNDVVLVDIGGRTVDICLFEMINNKRKLLKYSTILEGTLSLYSKVINSINNKYETNLRIEDGEKIFKSGLEIYGQKQDLSFLRSIIEEHVELIFKELILNYPIKTTKVVLSGGGSYLLKNFIEKRIPNVFILPNAQFANAIGFKKVGESLWQRY